MAKLPNVFCKPLALEGTIHYVIYWQYDNPISIYTMDSADIVYLLKINKQKFYTKYGKNLMTFRQHQLIAFKTEEEGQCFIDTFLIPRIVAYNLCEKEF